MSIKSRIEKLEKRIKTQGLQGVPSFQRRDYPNIDEFEKAINGFIAKNPDIGVVVIYDTEERKIEIEIDEIEGKGGVLFLPDNHRDDMGFKGDFKNDN